MFKREPQPDRTHAKSLIMSAEMLMRDANTIMSDLEDKRGTVVSMYKLLEEETVEKILTDMPIERLNEAGQGLRLAVLRNAGVTNVAQLLRMTEQRLRTSVRGRV